MAATDVSSIVTAAWLCKRIPLTFRSSSGSKCCLGCTQNLSNAALAGFDAPRVLAVRRECGEQGIASSSHDFAGRRRGGNECIEFETAVAFQIYCSSHRRFSQSSYNRRAGAHGE